MRLNLLIVSFAVFLTLTAVSHASQPLKYGISSMLSASNTFIHYEELNEYIADKLGVNSEIVHRENYSEMNQLLENEKIDFASICTGAMLYLDKSSYSLVAVPEINGKTIYKSYIIANKKINASIPADLKGHTFAMTDRLSNTGYLFPTYFFTKNFSRPESFFSKIFFTVTHDKSIYLVNKGVVDAAAVDHLVYESVKRQGDENVRNINILHISPEFGIPPIVASNRMSTGEVQKLRRVLLNMHKDSKGSRILKDLMIDRFTIPAQEVYDNVIRMKDYVERN